MLFGAWLPIVFTRISDDAFQRARPRHHRQSRRRNPDPVTPAHRRHAFRVGCIPRPACPTTGGDRLRCPRDRPFATATTDYDHTVDGTRCSVSPRTSSRRAVPCLRAVARRYGRHLARDRSFRSRTFPHPHFDTIARTLARRGTGARISLRDLSRSSIRRTRSVSGRPRTVALISRSASRSRGFDPCRGPARARIASHARCPCDCGWLTRPATRARHDSRQDVVHRGRSGSTRRA